MLSASEMNRFVNAPSIEVLWDMFQQKMLDYGFDRLIYGFTRYRTETSFGNPDDFVILTNHNPAYTREYIGNGLYMHAPMMRYVLQDVGAYSWSILAEMIASDTLTENEKKVIAFNQKHGVLAGYSISFSSLSSRLKGAISLAAKPGICQDEVDQIWQKHGDEISFINNLTHLRILSLPYSTSDRPLTARQREILGWVGDGKTAQDIALLLNLTPATVEKHLRLARATLSVETTAQAVLKAAFMNQIFVLDA